MKKGFLVIIFLGTFFSIPGQTNANERWLLERKLPDGWFSQFAELGLQINYELSNFINPFYLTGDFNGDSIPDVAITIREKGTGNLGFVVLHGGTEDYFILGAGNRLGNGGEHFAWMNIWKVYDKNRIEPGVGESETITLSSDAIYVAKAEAVSAVIYWTGVEYRWFHQGD